MRKTVVAGLLLIAGCNEYELVDFEVVDAFNQVPAEKVDILMVVDNSCSMAPYQLRLAANFNAFISFFIGANVDYQIGVATTTVQRPEYTSQIPSCTPEKLAEIPDAGHLVQDLWITADTPDAEGLFQDLVTVGTCGSGFEMGLESARRALDSAVTGGDNDGFVRSDAKLSVIFVSDEQDASPDPVNTYINDYYEVKGQRDRGVFNSSTLAVIDPSGCLNAAGSSPGTRYIDVAEQTHGVVGDLCGTDFQGIVTDLSLNASRLRDTFFLSQEPDPTTLQVTVDGAEWLCEDGGWTFARVEDAGVDKPAVVFSRDAMPGPGARIAVRYDQGNGDASLFCGGTADSLDTAGGAR